MDTFFISLKKKDNNLLIALLFFFSAKPACSLKVYNPSHAVKTVYNLPFVLFADNFFVGALPSSAIFQYLFFKDIFGRSITQQGIGACQYTRQATERQKFGRLLHHFADGGQVFLVVIGRLHLKVLLFSK